MTDLRDDTANDIEYDGRELYLELARSVAEEHGVEAITSIPAQPAETMAVLRRELSAFLLLYKFGIDEVLTKITILREEYEARHDHGLIEHLNSRVKSIDSLLAKVRRTQCPPTLAAIRERVRDIAGIRITCAFVEDVYRIARLIEVQSDITVLEVKDYITAPKANGYQSLHLILQVPVFLSGGVENVPVEVQIRTIAMDFWASLEHKIYYKYDRAVPAALLAELRSAADAAHQLDLKMAGLRDEIRQLDA